MRSSAKIAAAMLLLCLGAGETQPAPVAVSIPVHAAQVVSGAVEQTLYTRLYDPAYVQLAYPGGDPPPDRGVCSDVVVRAFRRAGIDLQKEVHEDMARHFSSYPNPWHLRGPDPNIDHRRVANLMTYFQRKGKSLPVTKTPEDYLPGDVVAWDLGNGQLHIGVVSDTRAPVRGYEIVHNIGAGARLEDVLFSWSIIGHYRYF
jgi:uncharacterized protein YijF (DUF1287 family)